MTYVDMDLVASIIGFELKASFFDATYVCKLAH